MENELPLIIRWETFPLDLTEPIKLFERSQFNYFYKDPEAGLVMGFWDVENGGEIVGDEEGGRTSDEIILVMEGNLYVSADGGPEEVAHPGDIVTVMRNKQTRIRVGERTKAFFLVWHTNPDELEVRMKGEGDLSKLPRSLKER